MTKLINGREQTNFTLGKIPNNLYRYPTLKTRKHNSPLLKCGLQIVTSLQEVHMEEWAISTKEKSNKHYLSWMIKVNIDSDTVT